MLAVLAGGAILAILFVASRSLFNLATVMLKVDLFAFGGGFASVPVMLNQVVHVQELDGQPDFHGRHRPGTGHAGADVITATFVGYQIAGFVGALVGTVAIFSPSFLMVLITVPYFDRLRGSLHFRRALRGVLASFVGLLLAVSVQFAAGGLLDGPLDFSGHGGLRGAVFQNRHPVGRSGRAGCRFRLVNKAWNTAPTNLFSKQINDTNNQTEPEHRSYYPAMSPK